MPNSGPIASGRHHLAETGMGYVAHFGRAARIGSRLVGAGAACFVHGLLPGLFTTKATSTIIRLHEEIKAAPPHGGREPMWLEFEI